MEESQPEPKKRTRKKKPADPQCAEIEIPPAEAPILTLALIPQKPRKTRRIWIGAAAIAILVSGAAGYLFLHNPKEKGEKTGIITGTQKTETLPLPTREENAAAAPATIQNITAKKGTQLPEKPNQFCTITTKIIDILPSRINPQKRYLIIADPDSKQPIIAETTTKGITDRIDNLQIIPGSPAKITLACLPEKTRTKYQKERDEISAGTQIPTTRFLDIEEYEILPQ